jgi:nucleotide-binding universal stress UspA family protein
MDTKKILVAVDGSEHSNIILEKAVEYATLLKAGVLLVYCHRKFPVLLGQPYRDHEISHTISAAENLIKPFHEYLDRYGVYAEERLMEEPAGTVIPDIARIEACELIIMGSRGLTNIASLIIGSVTNRVLQTAPCSVLVVR